MGKLESVKQYRETVLRFEKSSASFKLCAKDVGRCLHKKDNDGAAERYMRFCKLQGLVRWEQSSLKELCIIEKELLDLLANNKAERLAFEYGDILDANN